MVMQGSQSFVFGSLRIQPGAPGFQGLGFPVRLRSLTYEAIGASFDGGAITAVVGELWLQGLELWWGDRSRSSVGSHRFQHLTP